MKRFYKLVSIEKQADGYAVCLDGRAVKTQSKSVLLAPNEDIATCVMEEWASQDETITPEDMPFTQILNTKIDRVVLEREAIFSNLIKYLDTDLLCYHTDQPDDIARQQDKIWSPWLIWFEDTYGYALEKTTGLAALKQSQDAHDDVSQEILKMDDDQFTILQIITSVCGSLVLGLAFMRGAISKDQIFEACFLEELFKDTLYDAEKYGADPIIEKKQKAARQDFDAAKRYLDLL